MNDNDAAFGEQCRVCGGRIGAEEGRGIRWEELSEEECSPEEWVEQITAFVHTNCA